MHPRNVLMGAQAGAVVLPVCDHYCGVEARMHKSLALQAATIERTGQCLFDVTLDCEDGAPVGAEAAHAALVVDLLHGLTLSGPVRQRVGVRVHSVDHPAFGADVATIVGTAGDRLAYLMVPKVESVDDIRRAAAAVDAAGQPGLPLHILVESPLAVHRAHDLAAHPRVQSISFGLMDFVSAHAGAIPADAMQLTGQFTHPLVVRAKLAVASACHAFGKVPSHCVVTEFKQPQAVRDAATRAARELGYTRMWSIHPDQIEPIVAALAPAADEVERATRIIRAGYAAQWAPTACEGHLHDRASYRYFWQVLERAHQTGLHLEADLLPFFQPGQLPRR